MRTFSKLFVCFAMLLAFAVSGFTMPPEDKLAQDPQKCEIKDGACCSCKCCSAQMKKESCQQSCQCCKKIKDKDSMHKQMKEKMEKMDKELNLTDEQKTKMDILRQADREKRKELITQLIEKKQALDDELLKAEYDKTTVEGLTNDIRRISADIAQLQIDGKIQIRNILTLEQFQKIEQHKIKMREKIKSKKFKKRS